MRIHALIKRSLTTHCLHFVASRTAKIGSRWIPVLIPVLIFSNTEIPVLRNRAGIAGSSSIPKKGHSSCPPAFWPMSIVARGAHLSYCWALVTIGIISKSLLFTGTFFVLQLQMCKSSNLEKTLYKSSTVAQIAESFEPNTVLWAFHTIQPSNFFSVLSSVIWCLVIWVWYLMLQCPPANEDTLAIREASLLNPHERPPKHCKNSCVHFDVRNWLSTTPVPYHHQLHRVHEKLPLDGCKRLHKKPSLWVCFIVLVCRVLHKFGKFLANVNSRSRSLYAIARPSVVCLSVVCRLSYVTFVRPTQAVQIFGNISMALGT